MSTAQNPFLAVEPHLVARLQAALAGLSPAVHVLTAADLAGVAEARQLVPAVHVVWGGFRVLQSRSDGGQARLQNTWLAVTAVRNVSGIREGAATRAEATQLVATVGGALMGFRPPNVSGPLMLAPSPMAKFAAGFMYLPLAFTVESQFVRSPD